jgi:hypothetical protein
MDVINLREPTQNQHLGFGRRAFTLSQLAN